MPQYRALKTFGTPKGKHGTVITGTVLTMTQKDADELNRHHPKDRPVVELHRGVSEPRESPKDKSLPGAPEKKDAVPPGLEEQADGANGAGDGLHEGIDPPKDEAGKAAGTGGPSVRVEGGQLGGGRGRRSSVLRVGRPLPKRK